MGKGSIFDYEEKEKKYIEEAKGVKTMKEIQTKLKSTIAKIHAAYEAIGKICLFFEFSYYCYRMLFYLFAMF